MKKILKYSTIIGTATMLAGSAIADTGGYVRIKGFDSHFSTLGFNQIGCNKSANANLGGTDCKFASELHDNASKSNQKNTGTQGGVGRYDNELRWNEDDGEGLVVGADFGFFRLEVEGTYQDSKATQWRGRTADGGTVYQARLFANVVAEPFDLLELLGEYGGVDALVKYNPAHYGISPYAMYGYGVMGGLLTNLAYNRGVGHHPASAARKETGATAGGATAAVNVGAGVNIGLDQLARGISENTGASLPEYFKLPIEFSIGYHWQVGLDDLLFESMDEDLGIDDGGITYSVGLKW
jgi:hypothetical protein